MCRVEYFAGKIFPGGDENLHSSPLEKCTSPSFTESQIWENFIFRHCALKLAKFCVFSLEFFTFARYFACISPHIFADFGDFSIPPSIFSGFSSSHIFSFSLSFPGLMFFCVLFLNLFTRSHTHRINMQLANFCIPPIFCIAYFGGLSAYSSPE